jgi:FHA domain
MGDLDDTVIRAGRIIPPAGPERSSEPRPEASPLALYGFRITGSAAVVVLDRPALIGRNPVLPRIPSGFPPRLVSVASPNSEVSSTHLELRQTGTTVVVTDLRSTNGSVVGVPGQRPLALRSGESIVVGPGTNIDIGDGNVVEILPLHQVG